MKTKRILKSGLRLIIETDGNPVTIVMRLSKKHLLALLDYLLPDDPEVLVAK